MNRLFLFLFERRAFIIFLALQTLSAWFIVSFNPYQSAAFFTTSNYYAASLMEVSNNISDYFSLKEQNEQLVNENAKLRQYLAANNLQPNLSSSHYQPFIIKDHHSQEVFEQYNYTPAKVVNNSIRRLNNYVTINKGTKDGVKPGMGVINSDGVVGKVKNASKNFATITSLLHTDVFISSVIKKSGTFCSVNWDGREPNKANLMYVPRHVKLNVGDTVVTSGYNAVFPEGIMVGIISDFNIKESATFYDIRLELATDFSKLSHIYVVENKFKVEKDSLEQNSFIKDEW
jgi:rod shape-determining protein MreC